MKKYLIIALLVLILSCFVACDGAVDKELFGASGSTGPCWTIKIVKGSDTWYIKAHVLLNSVLYSDEYCTQDSGKKITHASIISGSTIELKWTGESSNITFIPGGQLSFNGSTDFTCGSDTQTITASNVSMTVKPGTYLTDVQT